MHRALAGLGFTFTLVVGCASAPPAAEPSGTTPEPVAPGPAAGAEQPAPATTPSDVSGDWVEYWALDGAADTQRYSLGHDGRFEWQAKRADPQLARRWGRYRVENETLVLSCEGRENRGGCEGAACNATEQPPVEERLPLGECPRNDEAEALDASYRCLSIGGHAFWRRR